MAGFDSTSNVRFVVVDDTTWPVPFSSDDVDGPGWVQRYGTPERVVEQRMTVASIVTSYSYLIDPSLSQTDAIAALKRARRAAKEAI